MRTRHAVVGLLTLLIGCQDDSEGPTAVRPAVSSALVAIQRAGFDVAGMEDRGSHYLVEGDIELPKRLVETWVDELSDTLRPGIRPNFQWRTTNLVNQSTAYAGLKVNLSGLSSYPVWKLAAQLAMAEWNGVDSTAVYLSEGTPADITFQAAYDSNPCTAATASFPGSGGPGPTITINTNYRGTWPCDTLTDNGSTKLRNMVHEIGHTLGFRHTNWQGSESAEPSGAIQIPGTPATDANSVMNAFTVNVGWSGFSMYDIVAIRTLYPLPALTTHVQSYEVADDDRMWLGTVNPKPIPAHIPVTLTWEKSYNLVDWTYVTSTTTGPGVGGLYYPLHDYTSYPFYGDPPPILYYLRFRAEASDGRSASSGPYPWYSPE